MKSLFPVFLSEDLAGVTRFYVEHFDFQVVFKADWYVQLHYVRTGAPPLELAFMLPNMDVIPEAARPIAVASSGVILTLDFDAVDMVYDQLVNRGAVKEFVLEPTDEAWGQRHFMFIYRRGLFVDVVQSISPTIEYEQAYSSEQE